MASRRKDSITRSYVHGYSPQEQQRLMAQAQFLEPIVFGGVDFSNCRQLLEIGCGVGAQSKILLEKFPTLKIESIDVSEQQLEAARQYHRQGIEGGRIQFSKMSAESLTFASNLFDGVFICWVLEHVKDPVAILREVKRCLKPGGQVVCMEVQNSTLFLHPKSPAIMEYWQTLNGKQSETGDPYIGAKLPALMESVGFSVLKVNFPVQHLDRRSFPRKSEMLDYWKNLLLSGADLLLAENRISPKLIEELQREFELIKNDELGVFFYTPVQVFAIK